MFLKKLFIDNDTKDRDRRYQEALDSYLSQRPSSSEDIKIAYTLSETVKACQEAFTPKQNGD